MTRKEARNEIDYLINDGVVTKLFIVPLEQKSIDALKVAKEALEKQIPMKPYKRKERKETNYYCPCKYYLGDETEIKLIAIRPVFCPYCGQAIDWSDYND